MKGHQVSILRFNQTTLVSMAVLKNSSGYRWMLTQFIFLFYNQFNDAVKSFDSLIPKTKSSVLVNFSTIFRESQSNWNETEEIWKSLKRIGNDFQSYLINLKLKEHTKCYSFWKIEKICSSKKCILFENWKLKSNLCGLNLIHITHQYNETERSFCTECT